ncbi:ubiquitin carboxyl-terminal hydrolase 36 isoform X2 [Halyomorpha halys]|uniref:ubiquitin carboxyl-terminal hydrolase 36 isoform X2 n=1 Tax=Halyomorpha halys TaxID=286706 RepID=UPI000D0C85AC|nr:ubiquitin carboxyl-terminal hydrolase 36 isoform X2 [Halyomorpha halys]
MPAQSGDPITSALRLSLSTVKKCKSGEDLDSRLVASAKQILFTEAKYEKNKCVNTSFLNELKSKYTVLSTVVNNNVKSDEVTSSKDSVSVEASPKKVMVISKEPTALPTPKRVLYSPDAVRLGWSSQIPVGSGFVNLGNSCYLNSILQALFHVPAFVNWLLNDTTHTSRCKSMNGITHSECLICAMSNTLQSSHKYSESAVKPLQIYSKLKSICKHLVHGHQEDAHEFLRYLIEGMERSYLTIFNGIKLDSYSKETTPLNQIFGGYLRSEVACLECQHVSTTFQHFQDLLLDIRNASSVEDALDSYFSRERLGDGEHAYRCEQCKRKVAATKKFSIERPPKALCIALKRFGVTGGKNSKPISVKQHLDINKYRHRPTPEFLKYKLVSLVTHLGTSSSCGHYTAVGQTAYGSYYLFDDSLVRPMSIQNVLNTNAYILMYEMETETQKQPLQKKEVSNGFTNSSNGFLSNKLDNASTVESKISESNSSMATAATTVVASPSTTSPAEVKPVQQNGLSLQLPYRPTGKIVLFGKPRTENLQANSTVCCSQVLQQQQAQSPNKINFPKFIPQRKESPATATVEKPIGRDKASLAKKGDRSPTPTKQQSNHVSNSEKTPSKEDNCIDNIPLPSIPDRKAEEKMFSSSEDERKSSPSLSLVPYLSESSDSEIEFIPPKSSPSKDSTRLLGKNVDKTTVQQKVKGVRIEVEGWDSVSNSSQVGSRPELHSPALSTSSGKWSVTSTEKEKTPDRQEKSQSSPIKAEANTNGNGSAGRKERWDGNRGSSSTMDHLMKGSHRGYGGQVNSWSGGRSELDMQVEGERNYLKRKRDHYNDDFDKGKAKKVKKFNNHNKDCGGKNRNRFQEYQNWKNNGWQGQRQKFYHRDYLENRSKPSSNITVCEGI